MAGEPSMTALATPVLRVRATRQLIWLLARGRLSGAGRAAQRQHIQYYRQLWITAAETVGVRARDLGGGRLEIDLGGAQIEVAGTHCSIDDRATLDRAGDKVLTHRLLAAQGVPMPAHRVFTLADLGPARRFLEVAPRACVVKPGVNGAVGRGVATGLRREADLAAAAVSAAAEAARASRARPGERLPARLARMVDDLDRVPLLIEDQVAGDNYRLLYLDGVLIDAIRRGSPTLTADGRHSIGELLDRMNAEHLRAGGQRAPVLVSTDLDLERTLEAQGLTLDSVPAQSTVVRLKTKINETTAENSDSARDNLCAAIIAQGALAAATLGARWAGVDVITADPTVPLERSGGVVLEVNTTPGLAMHLHGRPGQIDPAAALLSNLARGSQAP